MTDNPISPQNEQIDTGPRPAGQAFALKQEAALNEARSEIESLRAELAEMTAQRDHATSVADERQADLQAAEAERDELKREIVRAEGRAAASLQARAESAEAERDRAVKAIRADHAHLAALGGGPCICEWCRDDLKTDDG